MGIGAACALRALARACTVETWAEFDLQFRDRLVAGVMRAMSRGGRRPRTEAVGEMLQEVFCRLLEDRRAVLRSYRGTTDAEALAYLKRVAENVAVDQLRRESAAKRGAWRVDGGLEELLGDAVAEISISPECRLLERESRRRLWRQCDQEVVSRHRSRDLQILRLAIFEGRSSREIAAILGGRLTVSSIDSILHRVRRRLAACGIELPARDASSRAAAEVLGPEEDW